VIAVDRKDDDIEDDLQSEGPALGTMGTDPLTGLPTPEPAAPGAAA
jgi:hypothetical protein